MEEIAGIMDLSKERISKIIKRALQRAARRYPELRGFVAVDRPEGPTLTLSRGNGRDAED